MPVLLRVHIVATVVPSAGITVGLRALPCFSLAIFINKLLGEMPSELDQRTEGGRSDLAHRLTQNEETDNPKPNGALASDRGREGGTPVGLVALQ